MYVFSEYRRQGIGQLLCNGLLAHAANSGLKMVELWTARSGNGEALYQSVGFSIVEPGDFTLSAASDAGRGAGEVRMRRDL
jgi:GNAT superfamily N-acetyltransferase